MQSTFSSVNENLKHIFLQLMARYSSNELFNLQCWKEIVKQYPKNERYYHTLSHLEDMIALIKFVKEPIENLDALLFSILYHDIIYKATKNDNEHQSAFFFEKQIKSTSVKKALLQIEATKKHLLADDLDTNFLLDSDLAVLESSEAMDQQYAAAIRKEYKMYPTFSYNNGRKRVLENFINTSHIYNTAYFRKKYEQTARYNRALELKSLN